MSHSRGWKLLRKARIFFRWERRPFPFAQCMSFSIFSVAPHLRSSFDTDRREAGRITSTLCAFHSIWKRVASYFSSARNGSNVSNLLYHPGESSNFQRTHQFNNAWKNYHLETLSRCKLWFPKLFFTPFTYFLIWIINIPSECSLARCNMCLLKSLIGCPNFDQIDNCRASYLFNCVFLSNFFSNKVRAKYCCQVLL